MIEHIKKNVKNNTNPKRFKDKIKFLQSENHTLKQRLDQLESTNKKLETENISYLKVIKNKILSKASSPKDHQFTFNNNNIDSESKNEVLKLVIEKCEAYNEQLKDQLCYIFLSQKEQADTINKFSIEKIKDVYDKYKMHLEFNSLLIKDNKKLVENNEFLKGCILNYANIEADSICKRRKVVSLNGAELEKCNIDPCEVYTEYLYKKKYGEVVDNMNNVNESLNMYVLRFNEIIEYIYNNIKIVKEKIEEKKQIFGGYENKIVLLEQNNENLEHFYRTKLSEYENLAFIVKEKDGIIDDMQKKVMSIHDEYVKENERNRMVIHTLTKENMELEERIEVFSHIIENLNQNENVKDSNENVES